MKDSVGLGTTRRSGLLTRRNAVPVAVIAVAGALAFPVVQLTRSNRTPQPAQDSGALQKGLDLHREQKYDEAAQAFTSVIRSKPNLAEAYMFRGIARSNAGEFNDAVADFSIALKLRPESVVVYMYRGESYLAMGQEDAAARDFAP